MLANRRTFVILAVCITTAGRVHGVCLAYAQRPLSVRGPREVFCIGHTTAFTTYAWRMPGVCVAYAWRMRGVCLALYTSAFFLACSKPQRSPAFVNVHQRSLNVHPTYPQRTQRTPSVSIRYPYVVCFSLV
jgi:hypothetical protein